MNDDKIWYGVLSALAFIVIAVVVTMLVLFIQQVRDDGRCEAIGGFYNSALDRCIVDNELVEVPGE